MNPRATPLLPLLLACLLPLWACGSGPARAEEGSADASGAPGTPASGTAVVAGTTVDAATGQPLADVVVEGPAGRTTRSDAAGRFTLEGLPEGAAGALVASAPDGRRATNELRPLRSTRLEVVLHLRRP